MSQDAVRAKSGLSVTTIKKIERADPTVRPRSISAYEDAVELARGTLIGGADADEPVAVQDPHDDANAPLTRGVMREVLNEVLAGALDDLFARRLIDVSDLPIETANGMRAMAMTVRGAL